MSLSANDYIKENTKDKTKRGVEGKTKDKAKTYSVQIDKNTMIYADGEKIGKLKNISEEMSCDCPFPERHTDGEAFNYAHTVELKGGDFGVTCSGDKCKKDELKACYIPKVKRDDPSKAFGKEKVTKKEKKKKAKKLKKAKDPLDLIKKVFEIDRDEVEREVLETETAAKPVLFTNAVILMYGLSGEGKSYGAAKLVGETDKKYKIYLDGEGNGKDLAEYCREHGVEYVPADIAFDRFSRLLETKMDLSDVILVADSFHNIIPDNMSNNQSGDTAPIIKKLHDICIDKGMTIVVIEHATATARSDDGSAYGGTAKLEGNEQGKLKNADFAYRVSADTEGSFEEGIWLHCTKSRKYEDIRKGDKVHVKYESEAMFKSEAPKLEKKKEKVKHTTVKKGDVPKPNAEDKKVIKAISKLLPTTMKEIIDKVDGKNLDQFVAQWARHSKWKLDLDESDNKIVTVSIAPARTM